jgi:serine/threonine-protein kinase
LEGRFRVEAELARGGMGAVFSAIDESTGQRVALKRLAEDLPARASALFEREFYVLSSLKHPRIIEVYDYGVDASGPYYTMELLDGSDLRELAPVAPALACRYLRDVASSLALLHARRLLHRDVSPRNVRTLSSGGCKLIDFGALTSFGTSEDLVGTPPAIAPEALYGEPMDQRADLFSLGALAYYLLTGRHAYHARKVSDLAEAWREEVLPPSHYAEGVPEELDRLVLALLRLDPLARPATASEVIDRLQVVGGLEPDRDEQAARAYFVGAALVERDRELDRVARRLAQAREGRGSSVYVDANPGAGKTRFLGEVALKAQLAGTCVLRVDAAGHSGAFSTARALIHRLARLSPKVVEELVAPHAGLKPQIVEECLQEVARRAPLLIAVDNVDRADRESVALLLTLARGARTQRVLVLTTAASRPTNELSPAVRALRDAGTAIRLREITSDGVKEIVRAAFGDAPHTRRTAMRVFTAAEGNPGRCMRLLQSFVDDGLIRYQDGAWNLPLEIPPERLVRPEIAATNKLRGCSEDARRAATILAVVGETTPLEWFVAFDGATRSSRDVIAAFEELLEAEIVVEGAEGYSFSASMYGTAAFDEADDDAIHALHVRIGETLLAEASTPTARIIAGLHFIRGGRELDGADVIAAAAADVLDRDAEPARTIAKVCDAVDAALGVYRRHGKGNLTLLRVLVPLVVASYEVGPKFVHRYGEETVTRLERALGLRHADGSSAVHDLASLVATLRAAPVLDEGETKPAEAEVVVLVGWLISAVITLVALASTVIDHAAEERFAEALRPFTAFGPAHPASCAYEFCRLIVTMTEDGFAESHAGWLSLLSRLDEVPLPPRLAQRLRRGAHCALGVLECQRDDSMALARVQILEALPGPQNAAYANQLRFLYHGFRGEIEIAQRWRERVEEYAVQYGSAWQVEIWSTSTAGAFYFNTHDVAGNKRSLEQLERLKKNAPSLELYHERALGAHYLLTGSYEKSIEVYQRSLARSGPRERVGWAAVRGGLACAYNELERHDIARTLCEETLALGSDDWDFTAMTLGPRIELCRALAGLGERTLAKAKLTELMEQYAPNENPATMTTIHRTFAEVALAEDDVPAFEAHLSAMRRWVMPTKNPALIAQCDQLKNVRGAAGGWGVAQPRPGVFAMNAPTFIQSVFASCDGEGARKQRALELAAGQIGAREAWLFTIDSGEKLIVAGRLGVAEPPDDLLPLVKGLFDKAEDHAEETVFVESLAAMDSSPLAVSPYRLLPLTVSRGDRRLLVGTIALPMEGAARPVSHDLLQDIANQLFQAGDVATVRTFH